MIIEMNAKEKAEAEAHWRMGVYKHATVTAELYGHHAGRAFLAAMELPVPGDPDPLPGEPLDATDMLYMKYWAKTRLHYWRVRLLALIAEVEKGRS